MKYLPNIWKSSAILPASGWGPTVWGKGLTWAGRRHWPVVATVSATSPVVPGVKLHGTATTTSAATSITVGHTAAWAVEHATAATVWATATTTATHLAVQTATCTHTWTSVIGVVLRTRLEVRGRVARESSSLRVEGNVFLGNGGKECWFIINN